MESISEPIVALFERDLKKLREEILFYKNEKELWMVQKEIKNSAGNLALHLVGSLNFFIGATLGNTGYTRHRDNEFSDKNVPADKIIASIEELLILIKNTVGEIEDKKMTELYPIEFLGKRRTNLEILFIMYGHLNYHLGQINYHRRLTASI